MQDKLKNLHYYRWLIFGVAASGTFMSTLTSSIVDVAIPQIIVSLNTDLPTAQWVVSAYLLIITSLLPLAGRLGDIIGRRAIYSFGFIGFVGGSSLCGLAHSMPVLIAARLVQAVGAAALMANAPAIVTSNFPARERGKVLGMTGTVVALGALTGPSLGGLLIENFGWNAVFFVNIPVGILGFLGARLVIPLDAGAGQETIDYPGAVLFTVGMSSFLLVLSHVMQWGWTNPVMLISAVLAIVSMAFFVRHETRAEYPMLDLSIFRNWPFLAGNIAGTLSFMALFANIILFPYFLHEVIVLSPMKIGLVMSAYPVVMAVTAPFSGMLSDRMGSLVLTTAGLSIVALGLLYTANLDAGSTVWNIMAGQAVMGFGNGLFQSPNNNSVMSSVEFGKLGVAGGISALARNFGMVSGTALAVSIFEFRRMSSMRGQAAADPELQIGAFLTGYHDALVIAACIALLGVVISLNRKSHVMEKRH